MFETSDTRPLDALCDVNTEEKNYVRLKYSEEKIPSDPDHRDYIASKKCWTVSPLIFEAVLCTTTN